MWKSNDILETSLATLNFLNETIEWKPNCFNPKHRNIYLDLFKKSNNKVLLQTQNLI